MRKRLLTSTEKELRREASRIGRQAIAAIQRSIEHEAEYRKWADLAVRAKLDPDATNAPVWRSNANRDAAVAVQQAQRAAHEANKAIAEADRVDAERGNR